jgi:hypothetical protein
MEMILAEVCSLYHVLDAPQPEICPYHNAATDICAASLSSISIDRKRRTGYCSSDNYDNCALFLAKTLRRK